MSERIIFRTHDLRLADAITQYLVLRYGDIVEQVQDTDTLSHLIQMRKSGFSAALSDREQQILVQHMIVASSAYEAGWNKAKQNQ